MRMSAATQLRGRRRVGRPLSFPVIVSWVLCNVSVCLYLSRPTGGAQSTVKTPTKDSKTVQQVHVEFRRRYLLELFC